MTGSPSRKHPTDGPRRARRSGASLTVLVDGERGSRHLFEVEILLLLDADAEDGAALERAR